MKFSKIRALCSRHQQGIGAIGRLQHMKRVREMIFVCGALCLFSATPAFAGTLNYDFNATAAGGPLAGDIFSGTFSVDSAEVVAGSGNVSHLTIDILGTTVTQSEGVFGLVPFATFASNGSVTSIANFVALSTARASAESFSGGIYLPSPVTSFNFDSNFNYGIDPTQGENYGPGAITGNVAVAVSVPEPTSLVMFGTGLVLFGLLGFRRRRALL